jgi:UDP-3-O-[3-hydroxymyristoyl] glucosamine N-acyltransferase
LSSLYSQDGFGFIPVDDRINPILKKPQSLRVWIGSDVEVGANSTIDRGSWRDTTIGEHTKLDNQAMMKDLAAS